MTIYSPLPKGTYKCIIMDIEHRYKQDRYDAKFITLEVLEGDYIGRTIKDYLYEYHTNNIAEKIGQNKLRQISDALGSQGVSLESYAIGKNICVDIIGNKAISIMKNLEVLKQKNY